VNINKELNKHNDVCNEHFQSALQSMHDVRQTL